MFVNLKHDQEDIEILWESYIRAKEWMHCPWRTKEERARWYSNYRILANRIANAEEIMWGS